MDFSIKVYDKNSTLSKTKAKLGELVTEAAGMAIKIPQTFHKTINKVIDNNSKVGAKCYG